MERGWPSSPDCHTSQNCRIVHSRCDTTNRQEMEAKIRKFSSISATVTSLCNNETANTISHRSLIRLHSATFSKYNTYPSSNGTFNLNYYMHKINRADTPKCQCGFNNETIAHFLLYCPMYRAQSRVLHNNITKIAGRSASPLNLDVLLDQPKCTPSTLAFVDAVKLARTAI